VNAWARLAEHRGKKTERGQKREGRPLSRLKQRSLCEDTPLDL